MAFSFSIGMGGLPAEAVAVLTSYPHERVQGFYESGAIDREDPDSTLLDLLELLGHPRDGDYARRLVESHRVMRFEFQTGQPF
jgi:hypothetical protein